MAADTLTTVTRDLVLDASVDEVWRLLTDPAELSSWLGDRVDLDLRPGGAGAFIDGDDIRHRAVEAVVPQRCLQFVWWRDREPDAASVVTFTLAPDAGQAGDESGDRNERTRLVVEEAATPDARLRAGAGGGGLRACQLAGDVSEQWEQRLLSLDLRVTAHRFGLVGAGAADAVLV
jgi:uncharacterized protein YndB with AHSA1/START domain